MKVALALLLLASTAVGGHARASAEPWGTAVQCERCSTDALLEMAAMARGPGNYLVYSLTHGRIISVQVHDADFPVVPPGGDPAKKGDVAAWPVSRQPVPPLAASAFSSLKSLLEFSDGVSFAVLRIPAGELGVDGLDGATIYDVMGDANLVRMLADRLAKPDMASVASIPDPLRATTGYLLQGVLARFNATPTPFLIFRVVTQDGGRMDFKVTGATPYAEYQEQQSRTPGGQLVPEAPSRGTWRGEIDDLAQLADYMRRLGVTVTGAGSDKLTCSLEATTLACVLLPN